MPSFAHQSSSENRSGPTPLFTSSFEHICPETPVNASVYLSIAATTSTNLAATRGAAAALLQPHIHLDWQAPRASTSPEM
jgi:hypothetical protein